MRNLIVLLLVVALLIPFSACSDRPETYSPNPEAEVAVAYIYNGQANVATRIVTNKNLKKLSLTCVFYDITGQFLESRSNIDCQVSTAQKTLLWQFPSPELAVYMDCIISSTIDSEDQICKTRGIESWITESSKNFSIDSYQQMLSQELPQQATKASANRYVEITGVSWQPGEMMTQLNNLTGQTLESVYFLALWYDEEGQPLHTEASTYAANAEILVARNVANGTKSFRFRPPEFAGSARVVVQSVVFTDGTVWTNPYCYEWMLYHRNSAPNIIQK